MRCSHSRKYSCPPLGCAVCYSCTRVCCCLSNSTRTYSADSSRFPTHSYDTEQTAAGSPTQRLRLAVHNISLPQMRLLGSTALEEEGGDDRTPVPMDFLMEIMETRESLEQCSSQGEAEAIMAETAAAVGECLRGMDGALKAGGGKDELSDAAVRLRYLYRIEDEARRVLHRLEDGRGSPTALD